VDHRTCPELRGEVCAGAAEAGPIDWWRGVTEPVPDDLKREVAELGCVILMNYRQPKSGGIHPYVLHEIDDPNPPKYVAHSAVDLHLRDTIAGIKRSRVWSKSSARVIATSTERHRNQRQQRFRRLREQQHRDCDLRGNGPCIRWRPNRHQPWLVLREITGTGRLSSHSSKSPDSPGGFSAGCVHA
jgi:hypothetical protein